jgi:hypothetical protein
MGVRPSEDPVKRRISDQKTLKLRGDGTQAFGLAFDQTNVSEARTIQSKKAEELRKPGCFNVEGSQRWQVRYKLFRQPKTPLE